MEPKYILLPQIDGEKITFVSIYKNQFNSWNLKDEVILNPQEFDHISLEKITKVKIYNQQPIEGHFLVKIQQKKEGSTKDIVSNPKQNTNVHLYAISSQSHKVFFEKLLIYKFLSMNLEFDPTETFKDLIQDDMMKKSEILGNWEDRHVKITTQEGLTSKKLQKQKQSLHIKKTKEIWTRFDLLNHDQYVVIKVKYLLGKQQFGIPSRSCGKWVRGFYSLFSAE